MRDDGQRGRPKACNDLDPIRNEVTVTVILARMVAHIMQHTHKSDRENKGPRCHACHDEPSSHTYGSKAEFRCTVLIKQSCRSCKRRECPAGPSSCMHHGPRTVPKHKHLADYRLGHLLYGRKPYDKHGRQLDTETAILKKQEVSRFVSSLIFKLSSMSSSRKASHHASVV